MDERGDKGHHAKVLVIKTLGVKACGTTAQADIKPCDVLLAFVEVVIDQRTDCIDGSFGIASFSGDFQLAALWRCE